MADTPTNDEDLIRAMSDLLKAREQDDKKRSSQASRKGKSPASQSDEEGDSSEQDEVPFSVRLLRCEREVNGQSLDGL